PDAHRQARLRPGNVAVLSPAGPGLDRGPAGSRTSAAQEALCGRVTCRLTFPSHSQQLGEPRVWFLGSGVEEAEVAADPIRHAHGVVDASVEGHPAAVVLAELGERHGETPGHTSRALYQPCQLKTAEVQRAVLLGNIEEQSNLRWPYPLFPQLLTKLLVGE